MQKFSWIEKIKKNKKTVMKPMESSSRHRSNRTTLFLHILWCRLHIRYRVCVRVVGEVGPKNPVLMEENQ